MVKTGLFPLYSPMTSVKINFLTCFAFLMKGNKLIQFFKLKKKEWGQEDRKGGELGEEYSRRNSSSLPIRFHHSICTGQASLQGLGWTPRTALLVEKKRRQTGVGGGGMQSAAPWLLSLVSPQGCQGNLAGDEDGILQLSRQAGPSAQKETQPVRMCALACLTPG